MAQFLPLIPGDPDNTLLGYLSARAGKYVVMYTNIVAGVRAVLNVYKTIRQAKAGCDEAHQRNVLARARCYLVEGTNFFRVVSDSLPHD